MSKPISLDAPANEQVSVLRAAHNTRNETIDILDTIRRSAHKIENEATYRYIKQSYNRLADNSRFDASCTLLAVIGAIFSIGAATSPFQSEAYNMATATGKFLEQVGGTGSRFTQADKSELDLCLKQLEELQRAAQKDDAEIDKIMQRLDDLHASWAKKVADLLGHNMRNAQ